MSDDVESLAKAMFDVDKGIFEQCSPDHYRHLARAALAHIGRGISFEGLEDAVLDDLRFWFVERQDFPNAMACMNELTRRTETRLADKPAEKDELRGIFADIEAELRGLRREMIQNAWHEWREAIAKEVTRPDIIFDFSPAKRIDAILAAIAPLREKLERERDDVVVRADAVFWQQHCVGWQKRAEAAEAKLAAIRGAMEGKT